jgi:stress response protein YsnF
VSDLIPEGSAIAASIQAENPGPLVIPVVEEYLQTSKKFVTTGVVRIHKSVREREVLISESLDSEAIDVQRVPMNVLVESAPAIRTEGDVTVIPVLEEVLVTRKQLRLVEEIRITKRPSTRIYEGNAILRSEDIAVERYAPAGSNEAGEERLD